MDIFYGNLSCALWFVTLVEQYLYQYAWICWYSESVVTQLSMLLSCPSMMGGSCDVVGWERLQVGMQMMWKRIGTSYSLLGCRLILWESLWCIKLTAMSQYFRWRLLQWIAACVQICWHIKGTMAVLRSWCNFLCYGLESLWWEASSGGMQMMWKRIGTSYFLTGMQTYSMGISLMHPWGLPNW